MKVSNGVKTNWLWDSRLEENEVRKAAKKYSVNLEGVDILDPAKHPRRDEAIETFWILGNFTFASCGFAFDIPFLCVGHWNSWVF